MAKHKSAGKTTQQERRSGKRLGLKISDGEKVNTGAVLIKQRGTKYLAGAGVEVGRDHTLFASKVGKVKFGKKLSRTVVSVI